MSVCSVTAAAESGSDPEAPLPGAGNVETWSGWALAALQRDPNLRNGLNIHKGRVTNAAVAEALNLELNDFETALAA